MTASRHDRLALALHDAEQRDAADPLADVRHRFSQPQPVDGSDTVYFCGNSLGLMPDSAAREVERVLHDWGHLGVRGHFASDRPWLTYHELARAPLARLCGALASEVVAMNSLTVNLHLLLASFYRPHGERNGILIEAGAFPSDRYAAQSQLSWHNVSDTELFEWPSGADGLLHVEQLAELLERDGQRIAMALLPGVQFATGQRLPIRPIAELCQRHEVMLGLDLAHAIGNVPLSLHDDAVDFAVWCSYKYLNGGPGAVGGAFVHARHHASDARPRLDGWWGNRTSTRFEMRQRIDAAPGADAWQLSNPPILALAPVVAALQLFDEIGMDALTAKSTALTGWLAELLQTNFSRTLTVLTPLDPAERGCQLSLRAQDGVPVAKSLFAALEDANVIGDWREPDILRFAPVPMYNRFVDVVHFCQRLDRILAGP